VINAHCVLGVMNLHCLYSTETAAATWSQPSLKDTAPKPQPPARLGPAPAPTPRTRPGAGRGARGARWLGARQGMAGGWSRSGLWGSPLEPPGRAGVPFHPPLPLPVPLGDPPLRCCSGGGTARVPPGVGVTCTPPRPPTAGRALRVNTAHCLPLMNIADSGRQLRAPGHRLPPPARDPPIPSAGLPGVPTAAGRAWGWALPLPRRGLLPSAGSWGLREGGRTGGSPRGGPCPSSPPPRVLAQGLAAWGEGSVRAGRENPKDAQSSPGPWSRGVTPVPVPSPQQRPLPAAGPGPGRGSALDGGQPGMGSDPSSERGPMGEGSAAGGCLPTGVVPGPGRFRSPPRGTKESQGLGTATSPQPLPRDTPGRGDAQLPPRPRASLRRGPLPPLTSPPAR